MTLSIAQINTRKTMVSNALDDAKSEYLMYRDARIRAIGQLDRVRYGDMLALVEERVRRLGIEAAALGALGAEMQGKAA